MNAPAEEPTPLEAHRVIHLDRSLQGWLGRCECGATFGPASHESVVYLHEQHVHVQETRAVLEQGRRAGEGEAE